MWPARQSVCLSVRLSLIQYQRLNPLSDFHKILCRSYSKKNLLNEGEFSGNRLVDSQSETVLRLFPDRFR
jgi:hypothetical protein